MTDPATLPELLRETLREVLYGPGGGPLRSGLFSEGEAGLLRTVHALTFVQATAPVAPGRPTPAQYTAHVRETLEFTALQLADPHALLPQGGDVWTFHPAHLQAWRAELVALARAGQSLYDALYLPLSPEGQRLALGGVTHAAYHTGALRFHLGNLQGGS
ncbi:hypothetical protein [Deinococcus aerophilus]|uniref:DinB family protein n=1 Tax=Deinococcus aerophilus TaxID=522488 RepID=A0ABQ2GQ10_9DEIO|nr:hypothetical protein [Deinococcus aerophilus]GGM07494.1 hypothetical protein GCM10010841_14710 [Deinococcus aerophilus]